MELDQRVTCSSKTRRAARGIEVLGPLAIVTLAIVTFAACSSDSNGTAPRTAPSPAPSSTATRPNVDCVGKAMLNGQRDIDAAPAGTTFCLSGTHNWTLTPKAGDKLVGPATLDGENSTAHAIVATAPDVTLQDLTIQHYENGNGSQDGAIHIDDNDAAKDAASGWRLIDLDVGFNSASGSGTGNGWTFTRGRFHDNRQEGIGGAMGNNVTIDGVEIDHNNFTGTEYTKRNWSCGDEAGGVKWVTNDLTIRNSYVHHNACKGLWADLDAERAVIVNNRVEDNWDEGIFIEISSGAIVTGNTVNRNGLHNYNGSGSGCPWLWGGGITLASSDHATIANNSLSGNCNGITGTQQHRPDGDPGLLAHADIRDNVIVGPGGKTGVGADDDANLAARDIVFSGNAISEHSFCSVRC